MSGSALSGLRFLALPVGRLWLAGPGPPLLLASVPACRVFFLVTLVAVLRYEGADPRTGRFCQVPPYAHSILY